MNKWHLAGFFNSSINTYIIYRYKNISIFEGINLDILMEMPFVQVATVYKLWTFFGHSPLDQCLSAVRTMAVSCRKCLIGSVICIRSPTEIIIIESKSFRTSKSRHKNPIKKGRNSEYHHHHHHISVIELGHLLTRSGFTYSEVSSKVYHDSFCQLESPDAKGSKPTAGPTLL